MRSSQSHRPAWKSREYNRIIPCWVKRSSHWPISSRIITQVKTDCDISHIPHWFITGYFFVVDLYARYQRDFTGFPKTQQNRQLHHYSFEEWLKDCSHFTSKCSISQRPGFSLFYHNNTMQRSCCLGMVAMVAIAAMVAMAAPGQLHSTWAPIDSVWSR